MQTAPVETYTARKNHRCSWCGETIQQGTTYKRYRWWHESEAGTYKMHPECEADLEAMRDNDYWFETGDNPRGCNCGHHATCPKCNPEKETSNV